MSKGNRIVPVRIDEATFSAIASICAKNNTRGEPWTVSSWIRKAVSDKLDHAARAKRQKRKSVNASLDEALNSGDGTYKP